MTLPGENDQSTLQSHKCDQSPTLAQLELFIRLGNMSDLDPNEHFTSVLSLGNALIEGDLALIQQTLAFYVEHNDLVFEHIGYLKRAFAHAGVTLQEPTVLHYEDPLGQTRTAIVITIFLEPVGKAVFISSDQNLASYVHSFKRNRKGAVAMAPLKEEPQCLLSQMSRIIRLAEVEKPPPFSTPASY